MQAVAHSNETTMNIATMAYPLHLAIIGLIIAILFRIFQNIQRLRASKIPGPFLAAVTSFWRYRHMQSPKWSEELDQLHKKYGKLVRLGPNFVSVADAGALPVIYGTSSAWIKGDSYDVIAAVNNGREIRTIASTRDEAAFTKTKRAVGSAFATTNLLDYECFIDNSTEELFAALRKHGNVDIVKWFALSTMDMLSHIAFSESLNFVQAEGDVGGVLESIATRFKWWQTWGPIPGLERLLFRNPIAMRMSGASSSPIALLAATKYQARKNTKSTERDLLQKYLAASEKYPDVVRPETIIGMVISTIAAGADTTAVTLASVFYYVVKHPDVHRKLMDEFNAAFLAGQLSRPPKWAEVSKLPYLDVVIKESMRCWSIAAFMVDRVVPKGGVELAGHFIPEGTQVGCNLHAVHMMTDVWGDDADAFRPERWLEADEERRRKMHKAFLGFSMGKRVCIGMHIAELEMKKMIPHVLMSFDVKFTHENQEIRLPDVSANSVRVPAPIWVTFEERLWSGGK